LKVSNSREARDIGREILDGLKELKSAKPQRAWVYPPIAEIRGRVGLSQAEFATLLNVSVRTLQEWEQGRRAPSGPARTLLAIADQNPQALLDVAV
jgi:putative transcriptional regulator